MRIVLKICIYIFLSASISSAWSQDTIHFTIDWQSPVPSWYKVDSTSKKMIFSFNEASYNEQGIPVYHKLLKTSANAEMQLNLASVTYDTVSSPDSYSHLEDIPVALNFKYDRQTAGKQNYLQISLIPLILQNKTLCRVKEFSLVVTQSFRTSVAISSSGSWKSASVLQTGLWKKIEVSETGIYKITYSQLKNLGFTDPSLIRVYSNGGAMLPEVYTGFTSDDPEEIPIYMDKGTDGIFNEGDYILFYATGPVSWNYDSNNKKFIHTRHYFTGTSVCFLTSGSGGKHIGTQALMDEIPAVNDSSFLEHVYHEQNLHNLIKSGRNWVGESFSLLTAQTFSFKFENAVLNSAFTLDAELQARSSGYSTFTVKSGTTALKSQVMSSVVLDDESSNYADSRTFSVRGTLSSESLPLTVSYDKNGYSDAEGWLNYLRINARRKLVYDGSQLMFRDTAGLGQNQTIQYTISGGSSSLFVWDVTDIHHAENLAYSILGSNLSFKDQTDSLHEYVVFDPTGSLLTPDFLTETGRTVANQNLHGIADVDMVIVTHPDFLEAANTLAELHQNHDQLNVEVVTTQQVYNEFSSGNPDPAAIRNFMKMFYDRAGQESELPRYLLLLGDGSYENYSDNTSTSGSNTNFIPTYESVNSFREVSSYVSDDYYGLLGTNETIESGMLDIGVGRFPVTTLSQANGIVKKITAYMQVSSMGDWRNRICFLADDEDGNIHMSQANQLANYLKTNYPSYNTVKVFADAYTQETTSSGQLYPQVKEAILDNLSKGVLIFNYTGHGGTEGLGHEQYLETEDIKDLNNSIYPLFVTATCEFSRFDERDEVTAGEHVLLNASGGGIALFTTTRLVYSSPNFVLNQQFYKLFQTKDSEGNALRLGDIFKKTKNASGSDVNKLCFTLLGDPALKLAYPAYTVQTTKMNEEEADHVTDTLKAYSQVTVEGYVADGNGNQLNDFEGLLRPTLYDKARSIETLANDGGDVFTFNQQESVLYKGKVSVKNGSFKFSFVVPREIIYSYGQGRLSYYADNDTDDATGYFENFILGGVNSETSTDSEGPEIKLYLNDTLFVNGGLSDQFPVLLANLADEHGINIAGTGLGHNLEATLDGNTSEAIVLNDYFESAVDDYTQGTVKYQLPEMTAGKHTLKLKAWDLFNNSSVAEISFVVADSSRLVIKNVRNYPNPFAETTTFAFDHNQPGKTLEVELQIFNTSGSKVATCLSEITTDGFSSGPIAWDAGNAYYKKLQRGIYIFRFIVRYNDGEVISEAKKMVVLE